MEYKKSFAKTAKDILSKPFKSKLHVCIELGITIPIFDNWMSEIESFEAAVSEGFLLGERAAEDWLDRAASERSKLIDLNHYKFKFERIYGTGSKNEIAQNREPVKWNINIHHVTT